ncbi:MAG: metalloregulator ArsR/SmtB family transcription factor [Desulfuromonadales bacterium]|nr:metalloregulator ArsR/SmtB family transcription factor [Desulfuromonadales bacterium]
MEFDKNILFDDEAEILKTLGHPVRLKIVTNLISSKKQNVKYIGEYLGLPQATVSQHIALLKNKGIIEGNRKGVAIYYKVVNPFAKKLVKILKNLKKPQL